MFELVIFDFDDTIVHLDIPWTEVKEDVIRIAEAKKIAVDMTEHLVLLGNRLAEHSEIKKSIDELYLRYELECIDKGAYAPFSNMLHLIKDLRAKRCKLAIASGNHTASIKQILSHMDLLDSFDFICGRNLVTRNKPNPDQLLFILKKLKVSNTHALFAGDSKFDELAAKNAAIRFFLLEPNDWSSLEKLRNLLFK